MKIIPKIITLLNNGVAPHVIAKHFKIPATLVIEIGERETETKKLIDHLKGY